MEIPQDQSPVSWQRTLRFEDRPNGDVAVMEGQTLVEITRYSGEQGFVRGILRTLSRERMRRGIGSGPLFELIGHTDGRLTLLDPPPDNASTLNPLDRPIWRHLPCCNLRPAQRHQPARSNPDESSPPHLWISTM
jgi:hypothetical protein